LAKSSAEPPRGIALILKAAEFAARKHRDQRRKDQSASPYINHPLALAEILSGDGRIRSAHVLAAALLHDTLEDTETTSAELTAAFGPKITRIVQEVTDDKRLPKQKRKELQVLHAAHISKSAKLVKLADKIANLADIISSPPAGWSLERKREYFDWAKRVIDQLRGASASLERRFDSLYRRRP
jgi:GTP diphosphokinase / guanosine-3',5'-bis(diphosphate) 3'-diphosphatase